MALLSTDLEAASKLARAGRFADAAGLYRGFLAKDPDHPEANHFLGVCLARSGHRDEGLPFIERSVRLAPRNAARREHTEPMQARSGE